MRRSWKLMSFIVLLLAIGLFLVSCASTPKVQPHRPAFYADEKMTAGQAATGLFGVGLGAFGGFVQGAAENYRRERKARAVYPECGELTEAPLWKCVREIDIKEGRIRADYVEPERANMDRVMRGGQ